MTRIHQLFDAARAAHPDRPALTDGTGRTLTYAALDDLVRRTQADLAAMGLRPGDRLLVVAENAAPVPVLLLAASRMDAVLVPVNARMTAPELAKIAAHTEPRLTLFLSDVSEPARLHAGDARAVTLAGAALHVAGPFDAVPEQVEPQDAMTAVILYTTGTTGTPKGVMLTHANLMFGGGASARTRGMVPSDVILGVLPMTHVFGLTSMMVAALIAGAELRLSPRFSAPAVVAALQEDVTVLPAVPQMHALIMAEAAAQGIARLTTGILRYVSSGAAPLDPNWKRRAEAFYGTALQNGYGLTETTAGVTVTTCPKGIPDVSVGRPLPGVEVRLRDAGTDGVGEILVRGPNVMPGYFRNSEATAAAFDAGGFFCTGDLGRFDADGNLHIAGRARELIIRGGFNVYPPEVEAALNEHPAVVQTAVIGRTVEAGNEEVLAFCQVRDPLAVSEAALREFAAERLSSYKLPSRIVLATSLPAAPTGKILKAQLAATFARELEAGAGTRGHRES